MSTSFSILSPSSAVLYYFIGCKLYFNFYIGAVVVVIV